jgi:catechol 2,3-dioxygenase-like lactoylglutathione lyase family enzyme
MEPSRRDFRSCSLWEADMRLHHVFHTVPVKGAPLLRHFYSELLGLSEIQRAEVLTDLPLIWFQVGEDHLHFRLDDEWERGRRDHHIAILFDDLPPVLLRLQDDGYEINELPSFQDYGYKRFYVYDPFGRQVEMITNL